MRPHDKRVDHIHIHSTRDHRIYTLMQLAFSKLHLHTLAHGRSLLFYTLHSRCAIGDARARIYIWGSIWGVYGAELLLGNGRRLSWNVDFTAFYEMHLCMYARLEEIYAIYIRALDADGIMWECARLHAGIFSLVEIGICWLLWEKGVCYRIAAIKIRLIRWGVFFFELLYIAWAWIFKHYRYGFFRAYNWNIGIDCF